MNPGMLNLLVSTFGASCKETTFFGLVPWYHYLNTQVVNGVCTVQMGTPLPENGPSPILLVLLAVIDDLLRVAGLVAIVFIIWAGILYMTSQGSPDQTQKAQHAIQNALIGLVICILSIAIVRFIAARIG